MEPIDTAYQRLQAWRCDVEACKTTLASEADVRLKVIDPILVDVLGWNHVQVTTEENAGGGFIDYKLSIDNRARVVVEAKKDARDLGIDPKHSGKFFKLNGPVFKSKHVTEGIEQAIRYSSHKSAELAAVTNGRQWVVFRANRLGDGKDTLAGYGFVVGDLNSLQEHFKRFHALLSMESVKEYAFRAEFQQAEGEPIQATSFCKPIKEPEQRRLLPADKISSDIDRIMTQFFQTLSEPAMRRDCFVASPESDEAEKRLTRLSEDLIGRVQEIETVGGQKIAEAIRRVDESQSQAFGLLVGTKGAGKSTFVERFFADVLPDDLAQKCVVIRVDLADSDGKEAGVVDWLNTRLLQEAERSLFDGGYPTYEQLQGMYFNEYQRWSAGPHRHLYESDKDAFKQRFGEHVESLRSKQPLDYIIRMLTRAVRSKKLIPCLVFDNGDHFTIDFQERVFQYAKAASNRVICLTLLPITDKTSWQLSRQGALQSFFTETFHLPTPSPREVLLKRIQYLESLIAEEVPERGEGYAFGQGMSLSIDNLKAFVNTLQAVFVDTGNVAECVGSLSNRDIRRCLKLVRETITSPRIANHELLQAYYDKSTVNMNNDRAKEAIVYGKYDIYPAGQHEFVQNIFAMHTELATTPLFGVRILALLQDVLHQEPDGEARFMSVEDIESYFLQMEIGVAVTRQWLDAMLKSGLCWSYDPTRASLDEASRIEASPAGVQHLDWARGDLSYLGAMVSVTPLRDKAVHDRIASQGGAASALERRNALSAFVRYLIDADRSTCIVPEHSAYDSQRALLGVYEAVSESLAKPIGVEESSRFGMHQGEVVTWKEAEGYGFIRVDGIEKDVFGHVNDVVGGDSLAVGEQVECDIVDGKEGKKKAQVIRRHQS